MPHLKGARMAGRHTRDYSEAVTLYVEGMPLKALAARYGITPQSMHDILRYRGALHRRFHRTDAVESLDMAPEHALIAAVLRVAVNDAKSQAQSSVHDRQRIAEAQQWLRDRATVMGWIELANLPDTTYEALLREAGLEEDTS